MVLIAIAVSFDLGRTGVMAAKVGAADADAARVLESMLVRCSDMRVVTDRSSSEERSKGPKPQMPVTNVRDLYTNPQGRSRLLQFRDYERRGR